jgi:hypothetical protein
MARIRTGPADPLRGRRYFEQFCGISASTRRRWQQAGIIPQPDRVIARKPYWFESTLNSIGRPAQYPPVMETVLLAAEPARE